MKMKKRLFAILLALCVAFAMMPLTGSGGVAHAEDGTAANAVITRTTMLDLTSSAGKYMATNGKETTVDFTKKSVTDSAEGWSWNNETKTLTLSGARIVVTKPTFIQIPNRLNKIGYYYGVRLPGDDVTIVLTEGTENIIQAADAVEENSEDTVIVSAGMGDMENFNNSVTICGSGKLTVKGGKLTNGENTSGRISVGIYFQNVIVKDSTKLETCGNRAENTNGAAYSWGAACSQMTISDNAQVTAIGGEVKAKNLRDSIGIYTRSSLAINGSARVEAHGSTVETSENPGDNDYSNSMGISTPDFTASENACVYAYGGMAKGKAGSSAGVTFENKEGTLKLSNNAFLYAEGGESDRSSYGVEGRKEASISTTLIVNDNAYIEAVGKKIQDEPYWECSGISIKTVEINGGTVIARAEAENDGSNCSIAAISLSTEAQTPTYAENLTPTVTAGASEAAAAPADAASAKTYANRWVKIQTSEPMYAIAAAPSVIDFGTAQTGYAQSGPKTVMITNTGNETVELTDVLLQENSNYTVSKLLESQIAPRRTAEISVQPKEDLAAGEYNENLTISGSNEVSASVELKFNVIKSGGGSGGGGGYVPIQKPTILAGEGFRTTLSADGTKLTITAADGYEIKDILLNGMSKGSVTELSGLKTGDKVEIKTAKKEDNPSSDDANLSAVKRKVARMQSYARSSQTPDKNIKLVLKLDEKTAASIETLKKLGYTVKYKFYRSTKKSSGYKASIVKKTGTYINTSGKKGVRYYYKARIMVYDKNGKLIAQTKLKQCQYACRVR